jgi:hypothetical protein
MDRSFPTPALSNTLYAFLYLSVILSASDSVLKTSSRRRTSHESPCCVLILAFIPAIVPAQPSRQGLSTQASPGELPFPKAFRAVCVLARRLWRISTGRGLSSILPKTTISRRGWICWPAPADRHGPGPATTDRHRFGAILGKPRAEQEARRALQLLRGLPQTPTTAAGQDLGFIYY